MRKAALTVAYGVILAGYASPAFSLLQTCTVAATPLAFGPYNPASATPLAGSATVTVSCSALLGILESWTVLLGTGNSGTFAARHLSTGGRSLQYNLFTSAAQTQIWGDGTAGTGTVSDRQLLSIGTQSYPYTVYGVVSPLQDLPPGTYTDSITVTVNY